MYSKRQTLEHRRILVWLKNSILSDVATVFGSINRAVLCYCLSLNNVQQKFFSAFQPFNTLGHRRHACDLRLSTENRVVSAVITSVLLYVSGTWSLRKDIEVCLCLKADICAQLLEQHGAVLLATMRLDIGQFCRTRSVKHVLYLR